MIRREDVYQIGKLGKPHGIGGEVSFYFEDDIFDRLESEYLLIETEGVLVPFFMEEYRFRSDETALVKFCDIDSQEQARLLTGCKVFFPRQETEADTVSYCEIRGFEVVDAASNQPIGTLMGVDDNTINILFEIKTLDGKEVLVPGAEELIEEVDTKSRIIRIHVPEGILELS